MEILTRHEAWKVTKMCFFAVNDITKKKKTWVNIGPCLALTRREGCFLLIHLDVVFFNIYTHVSRDSNYNDTTVKETKICELKSSALNLVT